MLLSDVKKALQHGHVITTRHARERMEERRASAEDVERAIASATSATDQPNGKTRLDGGLDCDGIVLVVIVAEDPRGLRIITVM